MSTDPLCGNCRYWYSIGEIGPGSPEFGECRGPGEGGNMLTAADSLCCRLAFERGSYSAEPYVTLESAPSHAHMFGPPYPSSADPSVQMIKCKRCAFEREVLPSERGENG